MKTISHTIPSRLAASFLFASALAFASTSLRAQTGGPLAPPGAPAPTMKSLDQVEARTPLIDGAPGVAVAPGGNIAISESGSYYLVGNVTVTSGSGITIESIETGSVTVDLNGYTVRSVGSMPDNQMNGITARSSQSGNDIRIVNGHIHGGGTYDEIAENPLTGAAFYRGISATGSVKTVIVSNVSVRGCTWHGIDVGNGIVESCTVTACGQQGIRASVARSCRVSEVGAIGINATTVQDCSAWTKGESATQGASGILGTVVENSFGLSDGISDFAHGIWARESVVNSRGSTRGGDGIHGGNVLNCTGATTGSFIGSDGIDGKQVKNSTGTATGGNGIRGTIVSDSEGTTTSPLAADGIYASRSVHNSHGTTSGRHGINSVIVTNSSGETTSTLPTSHGIVAERSVHNSTGIAEAGIGIDTWIATGSYGKTSGSSAEAFGIRANKGNTCHQFGPKGVTWRYHMDNG